MSFASTCRSEDKGTCSGSNDHRDPSAEFDSASDQYVIYPTFVRDWLVMTVSNSLGSMPLAPQSLHVPAITVSS